MLDKNDLELIRQIVNETVREVVPEVVAPMIAPLVVRLDDLTERVTRLDYKTDALNRKIDDRFDEAMAAFNDYATKTDQRLLRLEARLV